MKQINFILTVLIVVSKRFQMLIMRILVIFFKNCLKENLRYYLLKDFDGKLNKRKLSYLLTRFIY